MAATHSIEDDVLEAPCLIPHGDVVSVMKRDSVRFPRALDSAGDAR
jgi:hypothetical protein